MYKKLAKQIGKNSNFKYFSPGVFIGKYLNYDINIKYDSASLLYNMNFAVDGKQNIDKLNEKINKIDKYAVARYKNKTLTITEACDSISIMPSLINKIIDIIVEYLEANKYHNVCKHCGESNLTELVSIDGTVNYLCDNCYKKAIKDYKAEIKENKNIKENIILGIIGSIIGSIPGIIIFFILAYLKINSSFAALIIMLGSAYGYKLFANSMKLFGLIFSLLIGFAAIILANELSCAYILYAEYNNIYNISIFDAYKAIPYYVSNSVPFKTTYIEDLVIAVIFGIFGGLSNFGLYRKYTANNKVLKVGVKNA